MLRYYPTLKFDNKSNITNYKPISIKSHLSKLFESLVLNSIILLVNNNILIEERYYNNGIKLKLFFSNFVFESFK